MLTDGEPVSSTTLCHPDNLTNGTSDFSGPAQIRFLAEKRKLVQTLSYPWLNDTALKREFTESGKNQHKRLLEIIERHLLDEIQNQINSLRNCEGRCSTIRHESIEKEADLIPIELIQQKIDSLDEERKEQRRSVKARRNLMIRKREKSQKNM